MLLQKNFGEEHIRELQGISHRDPVLLERAVYAFGLLEALAKVGMPFIFQRWYLPYAADGTSASVIHRY